MSEPLNTGNDDGKKTRQRIVVLDDEKSLRRLLNMILQDEGYEVFSTDDGFEALAEIEARGCALVVQDLRMEKMDGLTFLKSLKKRAPNIPVIVLTAFGTWETAVEAMRLGAYTHLPKPFDNDELRLLVARALERRTGGVQSGTRVVPDMIGATALMKEISRLISRVAPTDSTILITGESGTGKELVANAIHQRSRRSAHPFLPLNCGAFTETLLESELFGHVKGAFTNAVADRKGVFECADRGTLFLDEVGEMSPTMQVKLLRVLETRTFRPVGGNRDTRVDVRIIAATNRDLLQAVRDGRFREDLFYRLNVIPVHLPPLRERREDIPLLAGRFLARFAKRMKKNVSGFKEEVFQKLLDYHWPGNIRELENTVERAVALAAEEQISPAEITGPVAEAVVVSSKEPTTSRPATSAAAIASLSGAPTPAEASFSAAVANAPVLPAEGLNLEAYLDETERRLIIQALERTGWNLTEAAKLLGTSFRSIRYRVAKLKIERPPR